MEDEITPALERAARRLCEARGLDAFANVDPWGHDIAPLTFITFEVKPRWYFVAKELLDHWRMHQAMHEAWNNE